MNKGSAWGNRVRSGLPNHGKVIGLGHGLEARYWTTEQVEKMIQCAERKMVGVMAGIDDFNELENLALWILTTSAGITNTEVG